MEYSALDFYKDGSVILCFDTKRLMLNRKLTQDIRRDINEFMYLAYSDGLISYETMFCTTGRHSFDFLNGWRFLDSESSQVSEMTADKYGIWWDIQGLKDFIKELELSR